MKRRRKVSLDPGTFRKPTQNERAWDVYSAIVDYLIEHGMADAVRFVEEPKDPGSWRTAIESLESAVAQLDTDDLPDLHAALERLKVSTLLGAREPEPELLTAQDLAARWGVLDTWVYRQAREGKLTKVKRGKYVRFTKQAVAEFEATYGAKPKVL